MGVSNGSPSGCSKSFALLLVQAAPDAVRLVGLQRPLQALAAHRALRADGLCPQRLPHRRATGSDRKEQVGVLVGAAGRKPPCRRLGILTGLRDAYLPRGRDAKRTHSLFLAPQGLDRTIPLRQLRLVQLH